MPPAGRDDVMLAARMLAEHHKLIDVVQVTAVLQHLGMSVDLDWVRALMNALTAEEPPRLKRAAQVVGKGPGELIVYFELTTPTHDDGPGP
jgi:hypothetical protein